MPVASVAQLIDRSGSMAGTPLGAAKTDAATFANLMQIGDKLGVVSYSDNAAMTWPATANLGPITSSGDSKAAAKAIEALSSLNMTNIADAIRLGHQITAPAAAPRGMVLLSDGLWNTGADPRTNLPTDIPIYTVALGTSYDPTFMKEIATKTNGTYYYTPDAWGLEEIYNSIVGSTQIARSARNKRAAVQQYLPFEVDVPIAAGTPEAAFSLTWLQTEVQYAEGTPIGNQLTVMIRRPDGSTTRITPKAVGPGYVVFSIPSPPPGTWKIGVWSAAPVTVSATNGAFEYGSSAAMELALQDGRVEVGSELSYTLTVSDAGEPAQDVRVHALLRRPLRGLDESLALLGEVARDEQADGVPAELAALTAARAAGGADPHPLVPEWLQAPVAGDDGVLTGTTGPLTVPGEHMLHVQVTARGGSSGLFMRESCAGFVVVSGP